MPQAFLSHSSKDKKVVLQVAEYLEKSLVKVWIDEENIPGGGRLPQLISAGINKSKYFLMFVSNYYLHSNWCMDELDQVYTHFQRDNVVIVPVLLVPKEQLDWNGVAENRKVLVESILTRVKYIDFDTHNLEKSLEGVADALWEHEAIKFAPIKIVKADDTALQEINYTIRLKTLPTDFLHSWDVDLTEFISQSDGDQKPIRQGLPVAFFGISINWLITFFTIPFKNRRSVFFYNQNSNEYICAYAVMNDGNFPGKVLKVK
jgi:TIR domain